MGRRRRPRPSLSTSMSLAFLISTTSVSSANARGCSSAFQGAASIPSGRKRRRPSAAPLPCSHGTPQTLQPHRLSLLFDAEAESDAERGESFSTEMAAGGSCGLSGRRHFLRASAWAIPLIATAAAFPPSSSAAAAFSSEVNSSNDIARSSNTLTIPLRYLPSLSAYTLAYTLGGLSYTGIVDTGSPFLLIPSTLPGRGRQNCNFGCYDPTASVSSGLKDTYEQFASNEGRVEWRVAPFAFLMGDMDQNQQEHVGGGGGTGAAAAQSLTTLGSATINDQQSFFPNPLTFGVLSESLLDGPGGINLGLVRDANAAYIRPSFLGQSQVNGFAIDLRDEMRTKTLTLWRGSGGGGGSGSGSGSGTEEEKIVGRGSAIQLTKDLRKFGDPTVHYVAKARSVRVNGMELVQTKEKNVPRTRSKKGKDTYIIFDTGVSGMVICPDLFDERYAAARSNREKSLWGQVDVDLTAEDGTTVTLSAKKPLTTPFGSERVWQKRMDAHLIVVGLAFLDGKRMEVDIDDGRLWLS